MTDPDFRKELESLEDDIIAWMGEIEHYQMKSEILAKRIAILQKTPNQHFKTNADIAEELEDWQVDINNLQATLHLLIAANRCILGLLGGTGDEWESTPPDDLLFEPPASPFPS